MDNRASPEAALPELAPKKSSIQVIALPFAFSLVLAAIGALPQVRENATQFASFLVAAGAMFVWSVALAISSSQRGRSLSAKFVLRGPHWMQPLVQGSIYVYWGMHWSQVGRSLPLIAAQIVFAYAFDMLLGWSLGDEYELGFGPCPIILSMNLFMWFKPDWFYWQFVMVAMGFAAKRLIRWQKDGRLAHIFNPSSLPLAIVSIGLLLTGTTEHTWGHAIANTIAQPTRIYEFLFLLALPSQFVFGVATMSLPAVVVTVLLSQVYFLATGSPYFFAQLPLADLLGMLLLFTDPSTAPKSETGRVIYGMLYGLSVFVLYGILDILQLPIFYDKLLFVPFLNLGVRAIDRWVASPRMARFDVARLAPRLIGRSRNAAVIGLWSAAFVGMLAMHAVGDVNQGNRLPFWVKACAEHRRNACRNLATIEGDLCEHGSGWACNEYGIELTPSVGSTQNIDPNHDQAKTRFSRSCELGIRAGCANAALAAQDANSSAMQHEMPGPEEYEHLIDNRGLPEQRTTLQTWQWACEQGWIDACRRIEALTGAGPSVQLGRLGNACKRGDLTACRTLGMMYQRGEGAPRDEKRALACTLGVIEGCVGEAK